MGIDFIRRNNQKFLNPLQESRVGCLFRSKQPSCEELMRLARDISDKAIPKNDFNRALNALLAVDLEIDRIKQKVSGFKTSTSLSNDLMTVLAIMLVNDCQVTKRELLAVSRELKEFASSPVESLHWFAYKLAILENSIEQKLYAEEFIRNIKIRAPGILMGIFRKELPAFEGMNAELLGKILELRKYGVKTAYFQDGLFHGSDGAWLISRNIVMDSEYYKGILGKDVLADIWLVAKRDAKNARITRGEKTHGSNIVIPSTSIDIPSSIALSMCKDGNLDAMVGFGSLAPMKQLFASQGKEIEYELLRFSMLMRLWDLVVPLQIVKNAPPIPTVSGFVGTTISKVLGHSQRVISPYLMLPRIKLLNDFPHVLNEASLELEAGLEETQRRQNRAHEVVGHVRLLPSGYRPSAKAKALAGEAGIKLDENETWVMPHKRGKGEDALIPKAMRRSQ